MHWLQWQCAAPLRRWNRSQFWFWLPLLAQSSISPIFLIEARILQMNILSQWEGPRNHWQPIRGHKHPYSDWDTSIQINGRAAVAKTLAEVQSGIFSSSPVQPVRSGPLPFKCGTAIHTLSFPQLYTNNPRLKCTSALVDPYNRLRHGPSAKLRNEWARLIVSATKSSIMICQF